MFIASLKTEAEALQILSEVYWKSEYKTLDPKLLILDTNIDWYEFNGALSVYSDFNYSLLAESNSFFWKELDHYAATILDTKDFAELASHQGAAEQVSTGKLPT